MVYSGVFQGLASPMKRRVYDHLDRALNEDSNDPDYAYLPAEEKRVIRGILRATLKDWPAG
jgi:hypothetical protein